MCAAISEQGVSTHVPHIGAYNTQLLLAFLNTLYRNLIPEQERGLVTPHLPNYVVFWFAAHKRITVEFFPPYSPFLNPIEEFFSAWRWKVYDHRPQDQMSLLDAMNAACEDITADHCRGQEIFPPVHGNGKKQWCWWKSLAWPTRATGCPPKKLFSIDVILYFCGYIRNMKCNGQARFHFTCNAFVQKNMHCINTNVHILLYVLLTLLNKYQISFIKP